MRSKKKAFSTKLNDSSVKYKPIQLMKCQLKEIVLSPSNLCTKRTIPAPFGIIFIISLENQKEESIHDQTE